MNALANEALPLFLDELVPSYVAVIMSVTLVLFFGEIIPSAIFTGPNQLAISSKLAPLVRLVLFLLAPLAVPIAKALDYFLHDGGGGGGGGGDSSGHGNGHGGDRDHGHDSGALQKYDRNELSALVRLQFEHRMVTKAMQKDARKKNLGQALVRDESELYLTSTTATGTATNTTTNTQRYTIVSPTNEESDRGSEMTTSNRFVKHIDEVNMVEGALSMHTKKVIDVMQPWKNVFTIPNDMILNEKNIVEIYRSGHSRIPVYNVNTTETAQDDDDDDDDDDGFDVTQHICGLFKTKHLVVINSNDKRVVSSLELAKPFFVEPSMNMVDLLNLLQEAKGKMAIVCLNATEGRMALNKNLPIPPSAQVIGIVTLEDCLEELIQEEIYDEYDKEEMVAFKRAKWAVEKWKGFVKKRKSMRIEEDVVVDETSSLLHPGSVE
jgi:metal transporter CNNM